MSRRWVETRSAAPSSRALLQLVLQLPRALGVDADEGLVEEEDVRVVDEGAGDAELLPHPLREGRDEGVLLVRQAVAREKLVALRLVDREGVEAHRDEPQVLVHREQLVQRRAPRGRRRGPRFAFAWSATTSCPLIRACPSVGRRMPAMHRSAVVFPAPFGPRSPTISPALSSKLRSSTARWALYCLTRLRTWSMGGEGGDREKGRRGWGSFFPFLLTSLSGSARQRANSPTALSTARILRRWSRFRRQASIVYRAAFVNGTSSPRSSSP